MPWTPFARGEFLQLRRSKSLFKIPITKISPQVDQRRSRRCSPSSIRFTKPSTEGPRYEQNIWCGGRPRLRFFNGFPLQFDLLSKSSQSRKRHSRSKGADLALRVHTFVIGRRAWSYLRSRKRSSRKGLALSLISDVTLRSVKRRCICLRPIPHLQYRRGLPGAGNPTRSC